MTHVYEQMNRELILELYDTKKHLRITMEKLSLLERDNTAGLAAGQDENLQKQLADALERITSQTIAINNLESICVKLQDENMFLRDQNQQLAYQHHRKVQLIETLKDSKMAVSSQDLNKQPQSPVEAQNHAQNVTQNHVNNEYQQKKAMSIAMKLKLNLPGELNSGEPVKQPQYPPSKSHSDSRSDSSSDDVQQGRYEKYSKVQEASATQNCQSSPQMNELKTRSLMIHQLTKEIFQSDIEKHFAKYGKIIHYTDPPKNCKNPEIRFVFVKFETAESVEKALKDTHHVVKGIKLTCNKGKDF